MEVVISKEVNAIWLTETLLEPLRSLNIFVWCIPELVEVVTKKYRHARFFPGNDCFNLPVERVQIWNNQYLRIRAHQFQARLAQSP